MIACLEAVGGTVVRLAPLLAVVLTATAPLEAQRARNPDRRDTGTITIVVGAEPTLPIPMLSLAKANVDASSLLFLPLAQLGRQSNTTDEKSFEPLLAKSWTRRDPLTLVFDLDPRARWHDGTPVTSRDVVWTLGRARDSTAFPVFALLLREVSDVTAEGPHRVVFKFRRAYPEQLFDAVSTVPPLPAHLLDTIPQARLASSSFASRPIGSGPYRWVGLEPGRQAEFAAVPDFFLGRPKIERVIFLVVRAAEAQLNLVLDGTADAYEAFLLPRQIGPIVERPSLRIVTQASFSVAYLLFNQRAYGDRSKPHPILSDPEVRRAIALGIDRPTLLRSVFGPYASLVDGPMGQASWIRRVAPKAERFDPDKARKILGERGWVDGDGDGIREKNGQRLSLRLAYPGTSIPRVALAEPIKEMARRIGVEIELVRLDGPVWAERRSTGHFDIDFSQASLSASPSGLAQSWSCAGIGGSNVAQICDARFDSTLRAAIDGVGDASKRWGDAIAALQDIHPAVFMYSPIQTIVLHERYRDVVARPGLPWSDLWRWSVDPSRRIDRDLR